MSANVDLVRSIYADWERGDFGAADWAHPEIEFVMAEGLQAGSSIGLAAMAQRWREGLNAWERLRVSADEYRDLAANRVLVLLHGSSGRGKTSGVDLGEVWTKGASLFHISSGKVTKLVLYWDRERALADLGLKE
jgi:hypothetical protein